MYSLFFLFITAAVLSWWITGLVRIYAKKKGILDIPNDRSSHRIPTPKGGGLGIVAAFLGGIIFLYCAGRLDLRSVMAYIGGGIFLALVGWMDDKKSLPVLPRLLVHLSVSIWALFWLGGLKGITLGNYFFPFRWLGTVITIFGIAWFINLYNFMDGIDGIAGSQAVIAAFFGGICLFVRGNMELAFVSWLLAFSSLGFLIWNWPPAKIFMGDTGSCVLGYFFGVTAVISENSGTFPLITWLVLLGVFIVDSTLTLLRRFLSGEKWYEPHCTHAYQCAVRIGYSQHRVLLAAIMINLLLGIIALWGMFHLQLLLRILFGSYTMLLLLQINILQNFVKTSGR